MILMQFSPQQVYLSGSRTGPEPDVMAVGVRGDAGKQDSRSSGLVPASDAEAPMLVHGNGYRALGSTHAPTVSLRPGLVSRPGGCPRGVLGRGSVGRRIASGGVAGWGAIGRSRTEDV